RTVAARHTLAPARRPSGALHQPGTIGRCTVVRPQESTLGRDPTDAVRVVLRRASGAADGSRPRVALRVVRRRRHDPRRHPQGGAEGLRQPSVAGRLRARPAIGAALSVVHAAAARAGRRAGGTLAVDAPLLPLLSGVARTGDAGGVPPGGAARALRGTRGGCALTRGGARRAAAIRQGGAGRPRLRPGGRAGAGGRAGSGAAAFDWRRRRNSQLNRARARDRAVDARPRTRTGMSWLGISPHDSYSGLVRRIG